MKKTETEYVEYIRHSGVVTKVDKGRNRVTVSISDESDCSACPAAKLCSVSGKNGKDKNVIEITASDAGNYSAGERVNVYGTESMHKKAIVVAMVVPCVVLVAVMTIVYLFTGDQALSAISGLGAVILLYVVFYLIRNKIAHQFDFTIEKLRS